MIFTSPPVSPPADEKELLHRANAIAGMTLKEITDENNLAMPQDLQRHKGWVGQLFEHMLGEGAGSRAEPDCRHLHQATLPLPVKIRVRFYPV